MTTDDSLVERTGSEHVRPVTVAPTFNNAATLIDVLKRIERAGSDLIVVNDGATDDTETVLAQWSGNTHAVAVHVISHDRNLGKAAALNTGFAEARRHGYTHAVTMDTDGQLEPEEIPRLLRAARAVPRSLVIGRRREDVPGLPRSNLVGWYTSGLGLWLEIGVVVNDSQCGLRVYPLELFDVARCWSGRFGFEAEIIARAVWAGCPIVQVPVACHYPQQRDRVSHFKPWRDGAKGFFMHWGLALRRLVPLPQPTLRAGPPAIAQVSDLVETPEPKPWACVAPPCFRNGADSHSDLDVRTPKAGFEGWVQWLSPMSLVRQMRSSRLEQLIASAAFAHGVFMAFMPLGTWVFVIVVLASKRLHHNLWGALIGACLSLPPVGTALAKASITVGHVLTHFALPDFSSISPGAQSLGSVLRAFPVSWCLGGVMLGTIAHWLTIALLILVFRGIPLTDAVRRRKQVDQLAD